MQLNVFEPHKKLLPVLLSAALLFLGWFFVKGDGWRLIMVASACFGFTSVNVQAQVTARRLYQRCGGEIPTVNYVFSERGFLPDYREEEICYSELIKLIDDGEYLYLYISSTTAYMVECKTVSGTGNLSGMKTMISEKTSLPWEKPKSFLSTGLRSIIGFRR